MAFALGYYENDYQNIGSKDMGAVGNSVWSSSELGSEVLGNTYGGSTVKGLWNGNIAWMVTALPGLETVTGNATEKIQGMAYQYDQLNRIKQARSHRGYNATTSWASTRTMGNNPYDVNYSFDGNGNLKSLTRYGNITGTLEMDELTYDYDYEDELAEDWLESNQLQYVADNPTYAANYGVDIDGQSAGNYTYDAIGNLTADAEAQIDEIKWTTRGKIAEVDFSAASGKSDLELFTMQEETA